MTPIITKKYDLSVIIPTYKEELKIDRCIKESLFFLHNNPKIKKFEIIFVADKSGDKTIEHIEHYLPSNSELRLIVNETREQKGGSVKIGVLRSKYDPILFYDADLSTPLYEINNFLESIEDNDIIIGSRGLEGSRVEKKFFKIFLSRGFSLLKDLSLGLNIDDTQCGFKMFKSRCKNLFEKLTIKTSTFDVELLFIARKEGYKIKEIPITWVDSDSSNFKTSHVIVQFIKDLAKIKKNDLQGKYQ